MLIYDFAVIGNRLLALRKRAGLTQMEIAEAAGLSGRTYADIERGLVNMRITTCLRICDALHITPDEIFLENTPSLAARQDELMERLGSCSSRERETALHLLDVYFKSLN